MKKIIAIAITVALGACSTPWSNEPGSPEAKYEILQEKREQQAEAVDDQIDDLPDWYIELPTSDHAVYSAGSGISTDLEMAETKATLTAKRKLADRVNGRLTEKIREFSTEAGLDDDAQVMQDFERVTANVIRNTPVYGYNRKEMEVQQVQHRFRVYVLLEYPDAEINEVMKNILKNKQLKMKDATKEKLFKELDKELEKTDG